MSKVLTSVILIVGSLFLLRALSISSKRSRFERKPRNRWQALSENIDPTNTSDSNEINEA